MDSNDSTKTANLKKRIGENIRKIRQQANIEVKQVCSDLQLSPAAYSNIERGVTDISISRVIQLADYFAVHYSQILAVDNTTIYQFSQQSSDESSQTNQQVATMNSDGSAALLQAKEEIAYLREQNERLLAQLTKSK